MSDRRITIREVDHNAWIAFGPLPDDGDLSGHLAVGESPVDAFAALVGKLPWLAEVEGVEA